MAIRQVTLPAANVHDHQEFENTFIGDEDMVRADKTCLRNCWRKCFSRGKCDQTINPTWR